MLRVISESSTDSSIRHWVRILLLVVTRMQSHLNETLGHLNLNYVRNPRGKTGGNSGCLLVKKLAKYLVLLKSISEGLWSALHCNMVELIICWTTLQRGLSECW